MEVMTTTKLLETIVESIGRGSFSTDMILKLLSMFDSDEIVSISPEEVDSNCGFILRYKIGFKISKKNNLLTYYKFNDDESFDILSEEDLSDADINTLKSKMYDAQSNIKFRVFRSALVDIIRCTE